jgi:uncharacterized repeat protein (TIGR01451 family)
MNEASSLLHHLTSLGGKNMHVSKIGKNKAATFLLALMLLFVTAVGAAAQEPGESEGQDFGEVVVATPPARMSFGPPIELHLKKAGSTTLDLRSLPQTPPEKMEREEREEPEPHPVKLPGGPAANASAVVPGPSAPAPAPIVSFDGLDFATWGAGHPPDTNGDVGPVYYIQSVNTSIGIYLKTGGAPVAAFTFNTFMSQGAFGNLCDTNNFGDPVVLYDSFEDRWIITDFAFTTSGGNVVNPPGAFQCFAASKTGDPVSGGWNFYSINISGGLGDYPKFGIWPDGLYMSTNVFGFPSWGSFKGARVYALNKAQMYAGNPTVQVVTFNAPAADFTLLPGNARLQSGTPPAGTPNYFVATWEFLNALTVYKLHVDWDKISASTFTGPDTPLAATSWPNAAVANAPSLGGNNLDVLQIRAMMQNQYTKIGGVESLWTVHTVRRADTSGFAAPRWYQVDVTGGTVAANLPQAATWDPDGANVMHRFGPSVAVDRAGDMALGYSTSSSTTKPAIKYAGRLASDPVNTLGQTEQLLIQGTGTQTGTCGTSTCIRWGDYSAMTLDPDGCTFWYTTMYYAVDGLNDLTRIGSFALPGCTPVGAGGTLSGTVTATVGGAPISGATVALGTRSTTTNGSGFYSFTSLPAGTYAGLTAAAPGYNSAATSNVAVSDASTTTQNFSLATAPTSGCPADSTQADFQRGLQTNLDLTTSAGDVTLVKPSVDQLNDTFGTSGVGINITTWGGQTFTPSVTGLLTQADLNLFCSGCTGTTPNLTLSVRATSGGLPTGADLASATITGFSNGGVASFFTVTFGSPATLTAGTMYALVIRPVANPSAGTYALTRTGNATTGLPDVYANGTRVSGATSGTVWSIPLTAGSATDTGFRTYMDSGYAPSGNQVSALIDSNPAPGLTTAWQTLSWTATVPANTSLQFQVAGSNSATGPFNFVGPDATAGTFFTTSGASLTPQFDGKRYLKYKAYFATSNSAATPTLNDVTVCFTVVPPDLSLTKSDGGASVAPGGTASYTLTYANTGGQAATGTVLTETVPANTTFNSGASTAGWSCTPNNNAGSTCTLAVASVPAASGPLTATFAVTVVNPVAAGVTQIANTASIANDGTHGADPTAGNNSGSDTTPLSGAPDLSLTKSDGGTSTVAGATVSYTLTYANAGNRGATGVVLTETVPANTAFNAGASTAGWSCTPNNNAGSTCTLAIGGLAAGSGPLTATFAVDVDSPLSGAVTQISNTASISDDGTNGTDPTPGNNSGSDTTPVIPPITGYFYSLTPCRIVDTRDPNGPNGGPALVGGTARTFAISGACGVPADATAVAINVTVVGPTAAGDLRIYPTGITPPVVSTLNFSAGQTRANNAVMDLQGIPPGSIDVEVGMIVPGTTHFILDVTGYIK